MLAGISVAEGSMAGVSPMAQALPKHAPFGCFPVRLTVQTNVDELTLRLAGTLPGVKYLVMVRTNKPYAAWLPFTNVIGTDNTNVSLIRISLKPGKVDRYAVWSAAQHIPTRMLCQMQFTAGSGEDADGDGLPDLYEDLVTRTDPLTPDTGATGIPDGYKDPDGDGWCNLQEMYNGTDPLQWTTPPGAANIGFHMRPEGGVIVFWQYHAATMPQSFTIMRKSSQADNAWQIAGHLTPGSGSFGYFQFIETNRSVSRSTIYGVQAVYPNPAPWITPLHSDKEGILKTVAQVASKPCKDGYELTVAKTVRFVRYLMLVREGKKGFWKASGFFIGSSNGNPVKLVADVRGMLITKSPFVLPKVEHIPILGNPEFIAGSGEDADGDGLPDIYEVLVTRTDPDNSDTGATGVLDGYKDLSGDGWTALEKYRRRANPFAKDYPPPGAEIIEPTLESVMEALDRARQSDFQYEVTVETRNLNTREYRPMDRPWQILFPWRQRDAVATNLAVRITVQTPEQKAPQRSSGGGP